MNDDLLDAFWRYESALMANDLETLDRLFAPGPDTLRGDAAGILRGHDAISAFRKGRGGAPKREIVSVDVREIDADAAMVVAITAPITGGRGQQTQLWRRIDGEWVVSVAHVSLPAPAVNPTVWRIVGTPLVAGADTPELASQTVAVKDLFDVAGFAVGGGVPAYLAESSPAARNAAAVQNLLDTGASVTGIARTDEFAYSVAGKNPHYGTPPNGAVPGAIPGGSSSGPASAVATGQAQIGLATDTAGSIRVPASYQGLWGLRTTHGLVPRQGLLPLAQTFDTIGWLTRDGDVMQKIVDWCLSYDGSESTESVFGASGEDLPWRFAVPTEMLGALEPETRAAFDALLEGLGADGAGPEVEEVSLGDLDEYLAAFRSVQGAEAWRNNGEWLREHPGAVGAAVAERFRVASEVTAADEAAARSTIAELRARLHDATSRAVLIMPTVPGPAPMRTHRGERVEAVRAATLRMTTPAAIGGMPSISVPLLTVASTLGPAPVGVGLTSRAGTDIALVRLARRLARAAVKP